MRRRGDRRKVGEEEKRMRGAEEERRCLRRGERKEEAEERWLNIYRISWVVDTMSTTTW